MKKFFRVVTAALAMMCSTVAFADCTIYYDNSVSGWDSVNIHYWSKPSTTWPGVSMTHVEGDVWKYTFTDASALDGFLFCNAKGSDQTEDVKQKPVDSHLYRGAGSKGEVLDMGVYNEDTSKPSVTASPASGTRFSESITVTLSVKPDAVIYYTVDGSEPGLSSQKYTGPLTFTETTTLNTLAVTAEGKQTAQSFTYTLRNVVNFEGKNLITDYYTVNPNGKVGTNKTMTMTFNNQTSTTAMMNWTENELIAQGVARDVCMAFRGVHERPVIDSYAIYAAYDNDYLYLGAQFVYTVWDAYGEGKQPGESKPYNMDGAMIWAFDLNEDEAFDGRIEGRGPIWNENGKGFKFNNGVDAVWIGSTKPGVGVPGFFIPNPDGHASYDAAYCKSIPGKYYGYADGLLPHINHIWGQDDFSYDPEDLKTNVGFTDLMGEIAQSAHTFYEWKFPLSTLGITAEHIKNKGIGVMYIDQYGTSPVGGTPYDPSYFDNVNESYSQDSSTSMEKEDDDVITFSPARVGKLAAAAAVTDVEFGEAEPSAPVYYNLQGVRIDNPSNGLYIKVASGKATKVLLH